MSGTLLSACPSGSPLTPKFGCPFAPPSSWPLFPRELFNPTQCSGDYHIYLLMGGLQTRVLWGNSVLSCRKSGI